MFNLFKKRDTEQITETEQAGAVEILQQEAGLKEYVSFDSVKAHLVDILEENRRLKEEAEFRRKTENTESSRLRKEKELALIEADEYKKRSREAESKIRTIEAEKESLQRKLEQVTIERNDAITKLEMIETEMAPKGETESETAETPKRKRRVRPIEEVL